MDFLVVDINLGMPMAYVNEQPAILCNIYFWISLILCLIKELQKIEDSAVYPRSRRAFFLMLSFSFRSTARLKSRGWMFAATPSVLR